ncbi:putative Ig domain-containing protein [Microbulbifer salipaludis]|uniref:Ig domain-containing protein n=1 Tax=Microbulbifer salipaludis TaxID=187980 RepID=A0ABS3EA41_9GAMM|nr:putative Ig domain-containing protein [Microbulbifer salipaludis]MBN8432173.1 putative Ig domain-containing protein [Microbulbifer salipaludis]
MTAVITSNGLGFLNSSADILGALGQNGQASLGQAGLNSYVNAASGNLFVRQTDELLMGLGLDAGLVRTYNSQGSFTGGMGDQWRLSANRSLVISGDPINDLENVTIRRVAGDGSDITFTYDATSGEFVAKEGSGAHDVVRYDGTNNAWVFTADDGAVAETYNTSGQLTKVSDRAGNEISYQYNGNGQLEEILLQDGQKMVLHYNASNQLESLETQSNGDNLVQVYYSYDASGRLETVSIDLELGADNSIADGKAYTTTYSYDGSSNRIASITQSDGTTVSFGYELIDGKYAVKTVTDGQNKVTTYNYGLSDANGSYTEVVSPLGESTKMYFNSVTGYLDRLESPAVDGQRQVVRYAYDADGNLEHVIDNANNRIDYRYDANGNQTAVRDSIGNTVTRTYSPENQLLTETRYLVADPDGIDQPGAPSGAQTSRYVYNAQGLLAYAVGADGSVSAFDYDGFGQLSDTWVITRDLYDVSGLSDDQAPSLAQMDTWRTGLDLSQAQRTTLTYDFRGQLQSSSQWNALDVAGNGVGAAATSYFFYDQTGQLIKQVSAEAGLVDAAAAAVETDYATVYDYDGMSRVTSITNADGNQVTTTYNDGQSTIEVQNGLGLITSSVYDARGQLTSVTRSANGGTEDYGSSRFYYDDNGRLRTSVDAAGGRSYQFYNALGQVVYSVDAGGSVTEFIYNAQNQLEARIAYTNAVDTSSWFNEGGQQYFITTTEFEAGFKPVADVLDRTVSFTYLDNGQLQTETAGIGDNPVVTTYHYDGAGQLVRTEVSADGVGTSGKRENRFFYDSVGRQLGTVDAEGYLIQNRYDSAGRLVEQIRYANQLDIVDAFDEAKNFSALLSLVGSHAQDQSIRYYYNSKGQLIQEVSHQGHVTEYEYTLAGQQSKVTQYATVLSAGMLASLTDTSGVAPAADSAKDQWIGYSYDQAGRLQTTQNHAGLYVFNRYDSAGNLVQATSYQVDSNGNAVDTDGDGQTSDNIRNRYLRYDAAGQLTGELSAQQLVDIAGTLGVTLSSNGATELTKTQLDAAIDTHNQGVRHIYNSAGRLIESQDTQGNSTHYIYDERGQLVYLIVEDAQTQKARVTETRYNVFGDSRSSRSYAQQFDLSDGPTNSALNSALANAQGAVTSELESLVGGLADDGRDRVTSYLYNTRGQLATVLRQVIDSQSQPASLTTTNDYTTWGELKTVTTDIGAIDQAGSKTRVSEYTYDKRGLQISSVQDSGTLPANLNISISQQYDAFGRVTQATDARGNIRYYDYQDQGRTVVVTDPLTNATTSTYDAFGRVLTTTNALEQVTTYTYHFDAETGEQTTVVTMPGNITTENVTDSFGQTVRVTDAEGHETRFTYDLNGNLKTSEQTIEGRNVTAATNEYNAANQLVETVDAEGRKVSYSYDANSRVLTQVIDPDGLSIGTQYSYDGIGQTVSVVDAENRKITTNYDAQGNKAQVIVDPDGLALTTTYTYDANNNVTSVTNGNGDTSYYAYDALNRLRFVVDGNRNVTETEYDLAGNIFLSKRHEIVLPGSVTDLSESSIEGYLDSLGADASAQTNRFIYDDAGRQSYVVNSAGYATEFVYDGLGRTIATHAYSAVVDPQQDDASIISAIDIQTPTRSEYTFYNGRNEREFFVDAEGYVNQYSFDDNGRVTGVTRYDYQVDGASISDAASLATAVSGKANVATYTTYDEAGRERFYIDGDGYISETLYDDSGMVVERRQYELQFAGVPADAAAVQTYIATQSGYASQNIHSVYDSAGRVAFEVTADNAVTQFVYTNTGEVRQKLAYDVGDSISDFSFSALTSHVDGAESKSVTSLYDAAGRLQYSINNAGYVTAYEYDSAGNAVALHQYDTQLGEGFESFTAAQVLSAVSVGAARTSYSVYDAAGRVRFEINSAGYISEYEYDSFGNVARTLQYDYVYASNLSIADIDSTIQTGGWESSARIASKDYDLLNRVTSLTDAEGHTEYYGYDAFGNLTSFTNKLGSAANDPEYTWVYEYDKRGNRVREITPEESFSLSSGIANLELMQDSRLITEMSYDFRGQLISRTEGIYIDTKEGEWFNDPEPGVPDLWIPNPNYGQEADGLARTTSYQYDNRGNQIGITYPDVDGQTPQVNTLYDSFGNAVANQDVRGNYAYKVYDAENQLQYEIDAEGYITEYQYDGYGNQVGLTRYAKAWGGVDARGLSAISTAEVEGKLGESGYSDSVENRSLVREFDELNRLMRVTEESVSYFDTVTGTLQTSSPKTEYQYNAYGELTKSSVLISEHSNTWAHTYHYYNGLGQKVMTVDAERYVTEWQYNEFGQTEFVTEYARALGAGVDLEAGKPAAPPASNTSDSDIGRDRTRQFVYDKLGQVKEEWLLSYEHDKLETSSGYSLTKNQLFDQAVQQTQYDALGRVTETMDVSGNRVLTGYNKLGHTIWTKEDARNVLLNTNTEGAGAALNGTAGTMEQQDGVLLNSTQSRTPYVSYSYDLFGNVLKEHRYANFTDDNNNSNDASVADQITYNEYDNHGRLISTRNPNGSDTGYKYDLAGHVVETTQTYSDSKGTGSYTAKTNYVYDKLGQQITTQVDLSNSAQWNLDNVSVGDQFIEVKYNAFGEVIARGDNRTNFQESFTYDNAGRMTVGVDAKGADVNYAYDLHGELVREQSETAAEGLYTKLYYRDGLGRVGRTELGTISQSFSGENATLTPNLYQTYDRWGNVLQQTDAIGYITSYRYNQLDQVTWEQKPKALVVDEQGVEAGRNPETFFYYDLGGNRIAETDARGNTRYQQVDELGRLLKTIDALGAETHYAYDVFNREIARQNAVGYITTTEYDRLNNITELGDIRFDVTGDAYNQTLIKHSYNELNHQIQTQVAYTGSGATTTFATSYTDYDALGNAVRTESAEGVIKEYQFDARGRKIIDRNGLHSGGENHQLSWNYDYFGKLQSHNDLAGTDFTYEYYDNGLLKRKVRTSEKNETVIENNETVSKYGIVYTYYDNGALQSINDKDSNLYAEYEYDENGQRTYDYIRGTDARGILYEQATDTRYDEHGRLSRVRTRDIFQNLVTLDATYKYDEVGNRRSVQVASKYDYTYTPPVNHAPTVNVQVSDKTVREREEPRVYLGQNIFVDQDAGDSLTYEILVRGWHWDANAIYVPPKGGDPAYYEPGYLRDTGFSEPPSWLGLDITQDNKFYLDTTEIPIGASDSISYSTDYETGGEFEIFIRATDASGYTAVEKFILQVDPYANSAPTVGTTIPDIAVTEGDTISEDLPAGAFSDPEKHGITYSIEERYWVEGYEEVVIPGIPDGEGGWEEPPVTRWVEGNWDYRSGHPFLDINKSTGKITGTAAAVDVTTTFGIRVVATDKGTPPLSAYQAVNVVVNHINDAPVGDIPNQTLQESKSVFVHLDDHITDVNSDVLTFTATLNDGSALPSWIIWDDVNTLKLDPDYGHQGSYTVKVVANDGNGGTRTDTFTITVTEGPNRAPIVSVAIADQSVNERAPWSFQVPANTFTDPDGDSLTYQGYLRVWVEEQVIPPQGGDPETIIPAHWENRSLSESGWISFNTSTRTFTGTRDGLNGSNEVYQLVVEAKDPDGRKGYDYFSITVVDINEAPTVATLLANKSVQETKSGSYTFGASAFVDSNGDSLTYSAQLNNGNALPSWISFNESTRTFSWNPAYGNKGIYDIKVTANDGNGGTVSDVFRLTVTEGPNRAPIKNTAIPNKSINEGAAWNYQIPSSYFTDPDGHSLSFVAKKVVPGYWDPQGYWNSVDQVWEPVYVEEQEVALPGWLTFDASTRTFSGTRTGIVLNESFAIRVTVTDGGSPALSVTDEFTLTVIAANDAPTGDVPNQTVQESKSLSVNLNNHIIDVNQDSLTFSATMSDGSALPSWITWTNSSTLKINPNYGHEGSYTVKVTATDGRGGTKVDNFTVTVTEGPNRAPTVANAIANQSVNERSSWNFQVPSNTFTDPDGDSLTYTAYYRVWVAESQFYDGELGVWETIPAHWENRPLSESGWISFNSSTRTFTGTRDGLNGSNEVHQLVVEAKDPDGRKGYDYFSITVVDINEAPTVTSPLANKSVQETKSGSYTFSTSAFTDSNGDSLTFSAKLNNGSALPSWITFNAASRKFTWNPAYGNKGNYDIKVTANDGNGGTVSDVFRLTVTEGPNRAPIKNTAIPNKSINEGVAWSYQIPSSYFTDPDGHSLSFVAKKVIPGYWDPQGYWNSVDQVWEPVYVEEQEVALPSWLSFSSSTRTFTGTRTGITQNESFTIRVRVTDSGSPAYSVSDDFSLTVVAANDAPTGTLVDKTVQENKTLTYNLNNNISDANGDTLSYSATLSNGAALPSWITWSNSSTLRFAPAYGNKGTYDIKVTASDGRGGTRVDIFRLTVSQGVNRAPVVSNGISNKTTTEYVAWSYTVPTSTFSDPDGDTLTYTAYKRVWVPESQWYEPEIGEWFTTPAYWDYQALPSWLSFNTSTRNFSGTRTGISSNETWQLAVMAKDPSGKKVYEHFDLTVQPGNEAPIVANPIPNRSGTAGSAFSYTFPSNTFSDPNGDSLTYSAKLSNGSSLPSWLSFNAGTRKFSGTPTAGGTWDVRVTANDGNGKSVSDVFRITVTSNSAPILVTPIPNRYYSVQIGDPIYFSVKNNFSDPDGDTLSFSASGLPSGMSINSSTGAISGVGLGFWTVTVTASDGKGGSKSDVFTLNVERDFGGGGGINPLMAPMSMSMTIPSEPEDFIDPDEYWWNVDPTITRYESYWYTYDAENRMVIAEGDLIGGVGGEIGLGVNKGSLIKYDAVGNQVLRVEKIGSGNSYEVQRFNYNQIGQLISAQSVKGAVAGTIDWSVEATRNSKYADNSIWRTSTGYGYDLAGRNSRTTTYYGEGETRRFRVEVGDGDFNFVDKSVAGEKETETVTYFDKDGRTTLVENLGHTAQDWNGIDIGGEILNIPDVSILSKVTYGAGAYDAAGRLTGYSYVKVSKGEGDTDTLSSYTLTYSYNYLARDSYLTQTVTGAGSETNHKDGTNYSVYDDSGRLEYTTESYKTNQITEQQRRYFRYNGDGQIINKISGELDGGNFTTESDGSEERHYYYAQGQQIGSVDGSGRIHFEDQAGYKLAGQSGPAQASVYAVRAGDTLRSIAQQLYGSGSLWYLIADANGLADDATVLTDGQQLRIPAHTTSINDADTFKAYNAEEIIGDRTPAVPFVPPPPSADNGCGAIATIIMVVVAVVVTVYTAGAAATAFAGGTGAVGGASAATVGTAALSGGGAIVAGGTTVATLSAGAAIGGAMVGGFAGSVASQLVGKAMGVVDSFSLRTAIASGLSAGAGSAIGGALRASNMFGQAHQAVEGARQLNTAGNFMQGAATYISGVAAKAITGQETNFSWAAVAASSIGAGANSYLGGQNSILKGFDLGLGDFGQQFSNSFVGGAVNSTVQRAFGLGGKQDFKQIAADAFGNAVGNSIVANAIAKDDELGFRKRHEKQIAASLAELGNISAENAEILAQRIMADQIDPGSLDERMGIGRDLLSAMGADEAQVDLISERILAPALQENSEILAKLDALIEGDSGLSVTATTQFPEQEMEVVEVIGERLTPRASMDAARIEAAVQDNPSLLGELIRESAPLLSSLGDGIIEVSESLDSVWAKGALYALEFAMGPVKFAVSKAIEYSPVGQFIGENMDKAFNAATEFMADESGLDEGTVAKMAVGLVGTASLALGASYAIKNLPKLMDSFKGFLAKKDAWKNNNRLENDLNGIPNNRRKGFGVIPESVTTTSGVPIQPTPGKTTTILGNYVEDMDNIINQQLKYPKTIDFDAKPGGFNVLNVPDEMYKTPDQFWDEINKPFLDMAIKRGDEIPLATKPRTDILYRDDGTLTGYGREIEHLINNGYSYDSATGKMIRN